MFQRVRMADARTQAVAVFIVVVAVLQLTGCGSNDGASDDGSGPRATTTAPGSEGTAPAGGSSVDGDTPGWTQYGHDLANSRLDTDPSAITAASVGDLVPGWSLDGVVGVTGTPTVSDGVAYFGDWAGIVHAVDPATGDEKWTTDLGGPVIGSVPIAEDAVFAASGTTLYRLDRATGAIEWEAATHRHPWAMISSSPVVADGLVLQGVASGEVTVPLEQYSFRGAVGAWDAETGERVWRRFMTPDDATGGAGVGIWSTPAVDLDRGVLYVGTGNTYEEPTSPLADSITALDLHTGEVVWSTQFTDPDVFAAGAGGGTDADVGAAPNLWSAGGRDFVGAGDKRGVYYALDRDSGEVIWQANLTTGSMLGGTIGSGAFVDSTLVVTSNVGNPENNAPTNASRVVALDPSTGDPRWAHDLDTNVFAPVSAIPGVAFVGTTDGTLLALDVAAGDVLWQFQAPTQTGSGPSIADGDLLWGYGYNLFEGPGDGGLLTFHPESGDE